MSAPAVDVVIPTRDRPEFLRRAIASVRGQHYDGELSVIVVFDGQDPDPGIERTDGVPVRVVRNGRSPGLAGARNTGILAATGEFVAFLDDDDAWLPGKLAAQITRLQGDPAASLASTAVRVDFHGTATPRLAGTDVISHEQLLASRMSMMHSSTFVIRRATMLGAGGLVAEDSPQGQNEDWELLLRYSRLHPIVHVDQPLVAITWGSTSMFAQAWRSKLAGAHWVLDRHPDIATSAVGHARVLGQIGFAHAGLGERRAAARWALRALRVRWREPRGYLTLAAAAGVPPSRILAALHRRGRGV